MPSSPQSSPGGPSDESGRLNVFFRLLPLAGGVFVITIFALIATMFSDPAAPAVQWLEAHGGALIAAEAACLVVLALLAMTVDRREIVRRMRADARAEPSPERGGRGAVPGIQSPTPNAEP